MILSILILTTEKRKVFLDRLLSVLNPQRTDDVEILVISDDGSRTIGSKRNEAIQKSQGEYVCFVDDDDLVSDDYVQKILKSLESKPDCVGMHLLHFNDGVLAGFTYHSLSYRSWFESRDNCLGFMRYYRNPNHLNPIKRSISVKCPFPESSWGEDREYSKNILQYLHVEKYIVEPIYYYLFRSNK
jgi:glycosyltransferase involved in cell wall biosynthesis